MLHPLSLGKFLAGWVPAMAVSAVVDPAARLSEAFLVRVAGIDVPVVTCLLGALGVLMARPLARRSEAGHGLGAFLLVSAIMLIVVELWILESRPAWLFSFVVAIGLGFSGYSLIELVGSQMREFVSTITSKAKGTLGASASTPPAKSQDPDK